jgi:hypothetical protein
MGKIFGGTEKTALTDVHGRQEEAETQSLLHLVWLYISINSQILNLASILHLSSVLSKGEGV